jgi:hypothetical protein
MPGRDSARRRAEAEVVDDDDVGSKDPVDGWACGVIGPVAADEGAEVSRLNHGGGRCGRSQRSRGLRGSCARWSGSAGQRTSSSVARLAPGRARPGMDEGVSSQASKVLPVGNPAALRRAWIEYRRRRPRPRRPRGLPRARTALGLKEARVIGLPRRLGWSVEVSRVLPLGLGDIGGQPPVEVEGEQLPGSLLVGIGGPGALVRGPQRSFVARGVRRKQGVWWPTLVDVVAQGVVGSPVWPLGHR